MRYWAEVARRAWVEAAKTLKVDTRKLLMILVLGQAVIGAIIYLALGAENLPENILARCATIAAPLLLFVPLFLWEFISQPPKMHAEQAAALQREAAEKENVLRSVASTSSARDSTILDLQEENAALKAQVSEMRRNTDADYPFDAAQRSALIAFLSTVPDEARFPVEVRHSAFGGNPDYARRMARALKEADWNARAKPDFNVQPTNGGIHVVSWLDQNFEPDTAPAAGALLVREALTAAGVRFSVDRFARPSEPEPPPWRFFVFPPEG
jgi:hypothetical protein